MTHNAYIGIDLGTSGCRAYAIDDNANIIASSQLPLFCSNSTELNPQQQWQTVLTVLSDLISHCTDYQVQSIAVDATSGSILITDPSGTPLSPILMYNDQQALEQSHYIATIAPVESGAHGVGSGLAKLLLLQQRLNIKDMHYLVHQADWINFNLGVPLGVSDENNALKSGYDPVNRCWPDWLKQTINSAVLPKVVPPGTVVGQLSDALTKQLGLTYAPTIKAGTTDSIAALLATGASELGDAVTSLGSTLVVKVLSDKPVFIPEQGVYSHRLNDIWLVGGASNSGGAVLKQYFDTADLEQLSSLIDINAPVADYYPLLSKGERFPVNDPELEPRLSPRPDSDVQFLHNLLSGIAAIEQQAYSALELAGATQVRSIRTVGGGAINQTWQAIRQQKCHVPFITPKHTEAAYGSALLAKG